MITLNNISKSYGEVEAVKNVSFEVKRGELFGLIGPDGAGKTSIFRILTTLLLADSGSASIEGLDVVNDYQAIRNILGYMPGRFSLYQDLSIEENLKFFATVFGTTVEENMELIREIYVQIEPFKKRRAGKLSGGMKQKLALCCALIHQPKVLFLDEPTTGVDAVSRKEFWEMLQRLKSKGITIVVSTPYMDEAKLCDRIALIQKGEILAIDTPSNIVASFPKKLFAVKADDIYELLKCLRQDSAVESCHAFGEWVHITLKDEGEEEELKQILGKYQLSGLEFKRIDANIEDCFIRNSPLQLPLGGEKSHPVPLPSPKGELEGAHIICNKLSKHFGDFKAVDEISFAVKKGEIFGFLGANGAGKTTAMRMLCGLSYPTSGEASIAGFDVYTQQEEIKKHIGYMSQKFSLYDQLTILENIEFYGGIYGVPKAEIKTRGAELVRSLGLEKEADKLVESLPLGWKQKLAFSVAIFHRPSIVFLDEPTGGVDPLTRRQFWDMIYEAAYQGITVFVTTHYMDEAEYCDRISIMVDGKVKALDSPAELKQKYQSETMEEVFLKIVAAPSISPEGEGRTIAPPKLPKGEGLEPQI
ncbi:MAG: ATP-binding cassette domain-containing protein [Mangrovibacterium sp.]